MQNNNQNPMFKPKNQSGTNFVNTSRIKTANQGNQLGSIIGQSVSNAADKARTNIANSQNQFQQESDKNLLTSEDNKQKFNQSLTNAGTDNEGSQDQSVLKNSIAGKYEGPKQLQNLGQIQNQVSNVQQASQMGQSLAGRQALLQKQLGVQNYGRGKSTLDASLAGNTFDINKTKMLGNILTEQANRANQATQDTSNLYANINQQQAQQNLSDINKANIVNENAIGRQIGDTNVREGLLNEIRSQVDSGINGTASNGLSDTAKKMFRMDNFNPGSQSIYDYAADALTHTGDMDAAGQFYLKQAGQLNNKGFTDYKTGGDNQNMYTTMKLLGVTGLGGHQGGVDSSTIDSGFSGSLQDIIKRNLQKTSAQNISRQGLAQDSQIKRNNALLSILGKEDQRLNLGGDKYQQSSFNIDSNKSAHEIANERDAYITNKLTGTANALGNFVSGSNRLNRKAYGEAAMEFNDQGTTASNMRDRINAAKAAPGAINVGMNAKADVLSLAIDKNSALQKMLNDAKLGVQEYDPNANQGVSSLGFTKKNNGWS